MLVAGKIENMVITYLIGEDGKSCLEYISCLKEYFDYLSKRRKKDQKNIMD